MESQNTAVEITVFAANSQLALSAFKAAFREMTFLRDHQLTDKMPRTERRLTIEDMLHREDWCFQD